MSIAIPNSVAQALAAAKSAAPELKKLKDASQQMEGVFVKNLLSQMSKGFGKGLFGKMPGADIYQDMFTQSIADSVAKTGSFGIAKSLETQLSKDVLRAELAKQKILARKANLDISG